MSCAGSTGGTGGGTGGDTQPHATAEGTRGSAPQAHSGGTRALLHPSPGCAGSTGITFPLPCVEPAGHFDMWRDYLGLAATVATLLCEPAGLGDPSGLLSPCAGPALCAGPAPCVGLAPRSGPAPGSGSALCAGAAPRAGSAPCAGPAPGSAPAPRARPAPRAGLAPCSFCQHNGEAPSVYESHSLRDARGRLQCPVLRRYVCPQCGATQDRAHTRRFCPRTHRGYTSVYSRPRSAGSRQDSARTGPGTDSG